MLVFILRFEGLHSSRSETLAGNSNSPVDQREKSSVPIGCERREAPTGPFKKTQPVGSPRSSGASCLQHHLSLRKWSPSGGIYKLDAARFEFQSREKRSGVATYATKAALSAQHVAKNGCFCE